MINPSHKKPVSRTEPVSRHLAHEETDTREPQPLRINPVPQGTVQTVTQEFA